MSLSSVFTSRRTRFLSVAIIIVVGFVLIFPLTNPRIIYVKNHILGAGFNYRGLSYEEDRWDIVLKGVRSGERKWILLAADFKPVLDTHPGEEMLGAVSQVLDKNPQDAIRLLVPVYGAEIVCGEEEDGEPLNFNHATTRMQSLSKIKMSEAYDHSFESCTQIITNIHNGTR